MDLLFILLFFVTVFTLLAALISAIRGRRARALKRLRTLGITLGTYMVVVAVTSLISERQVMAMDEADCSDDWCVAVTAITPTSIGDDDVYEVRFRIFSRAVRITQSKRFVVSYMLGGDGNRYDAQPSQGERGFDTELGPGEVVVTPRFFRVPSGVAGLGVVVGREGGLRFPRCCIIGLGPFFKPPIWYPS